jgi:hypothetical protein
MKSRTQLPWQLLTGIALGALVGVTLAAPVLGWELPDASATMLGSALGAAAAVFGAFWLQRHEQAERRSSLATAMLAIVAQTDQILDHWSDLIKAETEPRDYWKEIVLMRALAVDIDRFAAQLFTDVVRFDYRSARLMVDLQMYARMFLLDTEIEHSLNQQGKTATQKPAVVLKKLRPLASTLSAAHRHFARMAGREPQMLTEEQKQKIAAQLKESNDTTRDSQPGAK